MKENFGDIIKKSRKEKKLTLRDLSKKVGISHAYLSQLESGHNIKPSISILVGLSQELDLPFAYLAHLVETDIGVNKNLGEDTLKLIKSFKPNSLKGIESFEDFKKDLIEGVGEEAVESLDKVEKERLEVLYRRMAELAKIENHFKAIAQMQSDLERNRTLNSQFTGWENPEQLPVEQIAQALKRSGYAIKEPTAPNIELNELLRSSQDISLNGRVLNNQEKQKALQILSIVFSE